MAYKDWPIAAQFGLAVVGAVLIAFAGWSYVPNLKQMREEITSKRKQLDDLNEQIRQGKVLEKKLPDIKREIALLEIKLGDLKAIIPPVREDSQLVERLRSLADRSRLDIVGTQFQGLREADFYWEYPISIVVRGSYHDLAIFFDRLSREARIFNVAGLAMQATPSSPTQTIQASFAAVTFIYKADEEEKPAPAAGKT